MLGLSRCILTKTNLCLDFDSSLCVVLWCLVLKLCAFMKQQLQSRNCVHESGHICEVHFPYCDLMCVPIVLFLP